MATDFLVLHDPAGLIPTGEIITEANARTISVRGPALIPVDETFFTRSGIGGFMRRDWGSGFPCPSPGAGPVCPMAMYLTPRRSRIHWRARIEVEEGAMRDLQGTVLLHVDTAQAGFPVGLVATAPVQIAALREPDVRNGWVIGGHSECEPRVEGLCGFMLWAAGPGLRVIWSAISQTT